MTALQLAAGVVITRFSYAGNSGSTQARKSWIKSDGQRERSSVSCVRVLSSVRGRIDATIGGPEREEDAKLVSRRWAAIVLPVSTTLGSIAFPSSAVVSPEVAVETDVEKGAGRVELRTLNGCGLGVARYPDFVYDAEGGGGSGQTWQLPNGKTFVRFDAKGLNIPAVTSGTTNFLGLPLPPGLKIEVVPKTLEGYVDRQTGKVELNFLANFYFSAGPLYHAPPFVVDTKLTTESAQGEFRRGQGQRLDSSGHVKLVGIARIAPVNDLFLSKFLTLPTDCLAELSANLSFS